MTPATPRHRLLPLVLAIGASVLLFACSGAPDGSAASARVGVKKDAPEAPPAPQAPGDNPLAVEAGLSSPPGSAARSDAWDDSEPEEAPPAAGGGGSGATFGSMPPDQGGVAQPPPARQTPVAGSSRVFSNRDLASYKRVKEEFGFRDDVMVVDFSSQKAGEAQGTLSPEEREARLEEIRGEMTRVSGEMQYLRGRIPSLHNPFLPRPRLSDSDAVEEAGMDNAERLARVNDRLAALTGELGSLQKRLAELTAMAPEQAAPARAPGD